MQDPELVAEFLHCLRIFQVTSPPPRQWGAREPASKPRWAKALRCPWAHIHGRPGGRALVWARREYGGCSLFPKDGRFILVS